MFLTANYKLLKDKENLNVFSNGLIISEVEIKYERSNLRFEFVLNPVPSVKNFLDPFNSCSLK